jgi:ribosomal 30S subunit maturation factor RimM
LIKDIVPRQEQMSDDSSSANLTGLSVYTKEDEDHTVGMVEDVDETGNLLIIRGSIDSREYSVPRNTVIDIDRSSNKIVLYMTRDDFIKYAKV